jgi:hypothetical protein
MIFTRRIVLFCSPHGNDKVILTVAMTRATFTIAVVFLCIAAAAPEVIFVSPCECQGFHGKNWWITKTDLSPVPLDKSAIQSVTPSQIYGREGLGRDVDLTRYTEERMPSEQKWYALTGRVVDAKVEADGDIHIALQDATGNTVGTVSAEIPVGPQVVRNPANCFRLDGAEVSIQRQNRARAQNSRAACDHGHGKSLL